MFTYCMPTRIYAGEGVLLENASAMLLGKRAMIVTGKSSGRKSGALDDCLTILEENHIPVLVYDKITNNPTIEETVEGGRAAREFGADFLIAIGGGSPMDAAKAIAVYAANEPVEGTAFAMYDIFGGKFANQPLPMAAIPTTAGTGSETTQYSILTLHKEKNKRSFASPAVFFKVAFLDGRYTVNLPLQIARNTAVDAMSHLLEGYTNKKSNPGSDYIALEGLRMIAGHLSALREGGLGTADCTELLWAASLGGMVIAQTGTTIVHSMGYPMTYYRDIPHGLANGLLLEEYLRRTKEVLPDKISTALGILGFKATEDFGRWLEDVLPCDKAFSEDEVTAWAQNTIKAKNVATCPFAVTEEEEVQMYVQSLCNV